MKRLFKIMPLFVLIIGLMACSLDNNNTGNNDGTNETEQTDNNEAVNNDNAASDDDSDGNDMSDDNANADDDALGDDGDQSNTNAVQGDSEFESGQGGFLWRVDNEDTTVYLQGTIHIGPQSFYPLNDSIESAYEEADVVVPEIDITSVGAFTELKTTLDQGVYDDGETIEDHIPGDVYDKLIEVLEDFNLDPKRFVSFKPWMLESTLSSLVAQELGYLYGVDEYFLERAHEDDKEIIELESVEEQFAVLSGQSDEFQALQLAETLNGLEDFEEEIGEMFDVYLAGDEDALKEQLFLEDGEIEEVIEDEALQEEYRSYTKALNDDRNVGMADTIEEFLDDGSDKTYFVIVGTAHLIEDPHVPGLLEEKGFEVERIY